MSVIRLYRMNSERECLADMVDKIYGIGLGMALVNTQNPGSGGIVDGGKLIAPDLVSLFVEGQEFHIDLHAVAGHAFLISFEGFDRARTLAFGQHIHAISFQDMINAGRRDLHPKIAIQRPGDARRAEVVLATKIKDLLLNRFGHPQCRILWAGLGVHQPGIAFGSVALFPVVESFAANSKVAASLCNIADLFGISKDPLLASDVTEGFPVHLRSPWFEDRIIPSTKVANSINYLGKVELTFRHAVV